MPWNATGSPATRISVLVPMTGKLVDLIAADFGRAIGSAADDARRGAAQVAQVATGLA